MGGKDGASRRGNSAGSWSCKCSNSRFDAETSGNRTGKCSWLWSLRSLVPSEDSHGQCTEPSCCHPTPLPPDQPSALTGPAHSCPTMAPTPQLRGKVVKQRWEMWIRGQVGHGKKGFASHSTTLGVQVHRGAHLVDAGTSPGNRGTWAGTHPQRDSQWHPCQPEGTRRELQP